MVIGVSILVSVAIHVVLGVSILAVTTGAVSHGDGGFGRGTSAFRSTCLGLLGSLVIFISLIGSDSTVVADAETEAIAGSCDVFCSCDLDSGGV